MDFRDRPTRDAVAQIARLLAIAYQRYRRARRIEIATKDEPGTVNGVLDNSRPESLHFREVDARRRRSGIGSPGSQR